MRVISPEKCANLLDQHFEVILKSTNKLQIIVEYFRQLNTDEDLKFDNLCAFAEGIQTLCKEIIENIWECDLNDISGNMKLLSPDQNKILKEIAYRESIGIRNESAAIELEE